jgi:hypothetical protein
MVRIEENANNVFVDIEAIQAVLSPTWPTVLICVIAFAVLVILAMKLCKMYRKRAAPQPQEPGFVPSVVPRNKSRFVTLEEWQKSVDQLRREKGHWKST